MDSLPVEVFGLKKSQLAAIETILAQYTRSRVDFTEHEELKRMILHTPVPGITVEASLPLVIIKPVDDYGLAVCEISKYLKGTVVICEMYQEPHQILAIGSDNKIISKKMLELLPG